MPEGKSLADATLYLSGVGLHHATVNGEEITDEVLAPGNTNYQLSTEYRTYDITDVLESGDNTVGVELGTGTAYIRRSVLNPAVGRTSPYAWWQSQLKGSGTLVAEAAAGCHQRQGLRRRGTTTLAARSTSTPATVVIGSSPA